MDNGIIGFSITNAKIAHVTGWVINGLDVGIKIKNVDKLSLDNLNTINCGKGLVLDNCMNSEISDSNINCNNKSYKPKFRPTKLAFLVSHFMRFT